MYKVKSLSCFIVVLVFYVYVNLVCINNSTGTVFAAEGNKVVETALRGATAQAGELAWQEASTMAWHPSDSPNEPAIDSHFNNGETLTIGNDLKSYSFNKGICAYAGNDNGEEESYITYNLSGNYTTLEVAPGVRYDNAVNGNPDMYMKVYTSDDGSNWNLAYNAQVTKSNPLPEADTVNGLTPDTTTGEISLNVSGINFIKFGLDSNGTTDSDCAIWGNPRLTAESLSNDDLNSIRISFKDLADHQLVNDEEFNPLNLSYVQLEVQGTLSDGTPADLTNALISYSSSTIVASPENNKPNLVEISSDGKLNAIKYSIDGYSRDDNDGVYLGGVASVTVEVTLDGVTKSASKNIIVRPYYHDYHKAMTMKLFLGESNRFENDEEKSVIVNFEEALDIIRRVDNVTRGIPKVIYLVGWQQDGHDHNYPDYSIVNDKLKRPEDVTALDSLKWLMLQARSYNTTVSLHTNVFDIYQDSPLFEEYAQNMVVGMNSDGSWYDRPGDDFHGEVAYNISYAREKEVGLLKARIDQLINMFNYTKNDNTQGNLLIEAQTIHIDAFHSYWHGINGMSPWHVKNGYDKECEADAQRYIYKYYRSLGIDVTSEADTWLRSDSFVGLQPYAWWGTPQNNYPESLYIGTTNGSDGSGDYRTGRVMHGEDIFKDHPDTLVGFKEAFVKDALTLNFLNCYKRISTGSSYIYSNNIIAGPKDGKNKIYVNDESGIEYRSDNDFFMPALWKETLEIIAYSEEGYTNKTWKLPSDWEDVLNVDVYPVDYEGLGAKTTLSVNNNNITLSLSRDCEAIIVPAGTVVTSAPTITDSTPTNKTKLKSKIYEGNKYYLNNYSIATANSLVTAIQNGIDIYQDPNTTTTEINDAVGVINSAIDGLVEDTNYIVDVRGESIININKNSTLEQLNSILPFTVSTWKYFVTKPNGSHAPATVIPGNVTWDTSTVNLNKPGTYLLKGTIDSFVDGNDIDNRKALKAYIYVTVTQAEAPPVIDEKIALRGANAQAGELAWQEASTMGWHPSDSPNEPAIDSHFNNGETLIIGNDTKSYSFDRGICTYAGNDNGEGESYIIYNLSGNYTTLEVAPGVRYDNAVNGNPDMYMKVYTSDDGINWNLAYNAQVTKSNPLPEADSINGLTPDVTTGNISLNVSGINYIKLGVDSNGTTDSDCAIWGNPRLSFVAEDDWVYLSDLDWEHVVSQSYIDNKPPTKDKCFYQGEGGEDDGGETRKLGINGVYYDKGIGAHSGHEIIYDINGQYTSFTATIGPDDSCNLSKDMGIMTVKIYSDGKEVYDSGEMKRETNDVRDVNIDLTGVDELKFLVEPGENTWSDQIAIVNAKLYPVDQDQGQDIKKIFIDGTLLQDFNPFKYEYNVIMQVGDIVPTVSIETEEGITSQIAQAPSIPGTATITVGNNIYRIHFSVEKPQLTFEITSNAQLDREKGIKAIATVKPAEGVEEHTGNEVVLFQLMKGTTPISIVALEKDIILEETLSAYFNVSDPNNEEYIVQVFVFDQFNVDETGPENLANVLELK